MSSWHSSWLGGPVDVELHGVEATALDTSLSRESSREPTDLQPLAVFQEAMPSRPPASPPPSCEVESVVAGPHLDRLPDVPLLLVYGWLPAADMARVGALARSFLSRRGELTNGDVATLAEVAAERRLETRTDSWRWSRRSGESILLLLHMVEVGGSRSPLSPLHVRTVICDTYNSADG